MERIEILISKLKDQYDQNAGASQMLMTVHLIENELAAHSIGQRKGLGTSKVSVVLPRSMVVNFAREDDFPAENELLVKEVLPIAEIKHDKKTAERENVPEEKESQPEESPVVLKEKAIIIKAEEEPLEHRKYMPTFNGHHNEQMNLGFDPLLEIPTLAQQTSVKEINDAMIEQQESLNDRLKEQKVELVETLKDTPIRDLRKGVGINDRFVFINELFRGDEAMYERSIKTINSFNIYAEAEYWINRELKTKIGWDDRKNIVQHFYHLVKRRFS